MKKILSKAFVSAAVLTVAAAQSSVFSVSAAETEYEGGKYAKIYISTESGNGNEIEKADGYQNSTIAVVSPVDGKGEFSVNETTGKIKVRGNSTSLAEKKPFNIKFDKKQDVLGMGSGKKWCLLANCFDPSLMRNYTAFEIARELKLPYTPDTAFAELWLDDVYKGSYLISEPVESGSTRIDIDTEADDFMIEYEAYRNEELVAYITSDEGNLRFAVSEPEMPDKSDYKDDESEKYDEDMEAYNLRINDISDKINNITDTIKKGDYKEICDVIDIESFVDYYVLNEIMKTCDFGWSSVNFYYKEGKLYAGPVWDYDLSSGNTNPDYPSLVTSESEKAYVEKYADFSSNSSAEGMYAANYNFYKYLTASEDFMNDVKKVFLEEQEYINNLSAEGGILDSAYSENEEMFKRNFASAEEGGAGWVVSKSYADTMRTPDSTLEENFSYFKNWISERNDYLYEAWIGHEFSDEGLCKHCGISINDCSVAGHIYDGRKCTVCGQLSPEENKMLFTNNMVPGNIYDIKEYDCAHISGVKIKFRNDIASDFSGAVVLGDYVVMGNINSSTCCGSSFEFSFDPCSLWKAPDTVTVYRWYGENPEIEEIEFVYTEEALPEVPENSVVLTSENNTFDISDYNPENLKSVTIVLENEVYNGGGQIVSDNWSASSFVINRACGKTVTVDVSNMSDTFSVNFWNEDSVIESIILNY